MREIRQSGSEGGVALTPPSLPLSNDRLKAGLQTATVRSAGFSLPPPKGGTTNDRLKAGLRTTA